LPSSSINVGFSSAAWAASDFLLAVLAGLTALTLGTGSDPE
jgi:hypothetical protein